MSTIPLFSSCPTKTRAAVTHLFFDVDDTVTLDGHLPLEAAQALYRAKDLGLSLVAVTGRSLSWAEMLVRLFPLDAAIGETGAACFYWTDVEGSDDGRRRIEVLHVEPDIAVREENFRKRKVAEKEVLAKVPRARLALDNMGRVYDSAFDLVEDGPPMTVEEATQIRDILTAHDMVIAQSSVHINAWFGAFDKASMVARYFADVCSTSLDAIAPHLVYAGDSKNDGPMFAKTALSVGVKNVAPHLDALAAVGQAPGYLASQPGGFGFAEIVEAIAAARS